MPVEHIFVSDNSVVPVPQGVYKYFMPVFQRRLLLDRLAN